MIQIKMKKKVLVKRYACIYDETRKEHNRNKDFEDK